ncbi:bdc80d05-6224-4c4c-ab1c-f5205987abb5 [Thermothielavioides terrestris]|uniref:Bdc80d05-6224-4c4c-ab1c-f5205987abb5 n=1 Tax=Thermothielavioides terrestris TaxID=2587410 RepID=A0A446BY82_9PEZI|nr:bdc80d05-6224-4c4c-ab1c-f5205987abb5 [Thermothielavioides terrestris]
MASSHIIRVPRTDEEGAFVLGEVIPSGSKPLNVKFVATEGEEPYVVKLRHDRPPPRGEQMEGIEAGAEANVGKSITITIRRRVAGINQRLGALTLNHKADEAIQLFDWCGAAALEREKFRETLATEKAKVSDLEARIAELRNQLDELTEAKKAREAELLEKFCGLLNEKKVKIREQQRLLNTAQVDPSRLAAARAAQAARSRATEPRKPGASRRAKRKALEDASGGGSSSDSDDGFEKVNAGADKMDVDPKQPEPPEERNESPESEDRQTTDDDATGSEPEDNEAPPPPSPPPKTRPQREPEPKGRASAGGHAAKGKDVAIHPPKRPLRTTTSKAATPPPAAGSETESDDEL